MDEAVLIVVVDDCDLIRDALSALFEREGFDVLAVQNGRQLREAVETRPADLVIVDLQMPGEDGFSVVRFLREHCECGIIMLTGKADPVERVVGLEIGADDFVAKPYEPRELLARVRSVLRRVKKAGQPGPGLAVQPTLPSTRDFGEWQLDLDGRRIVGRGASVELTNAEFNLLDDMTGKPGRVLTREYLLQAVYARPWDYYDRSIDVLVTRVRRKLEQVSADARVIVAVRGAGYMFRPHASVAAA